MNTVEVSGEGQALGGRRADRVERLYTEHAPAGMRLAYLLTGDRELAEDLVQDAFVRIVGRFRHLRIKRSFSAYLSRTIVNLARDKGRRLQLERAHLERERRALPANVAATDVGLKDQLLNALQTLPPRQRAAVVLRYYQDLSEHQVADALDLSVPAAKSLISRGMESLRKILGGPDGE